MFFKALAGFLNLLLGAVSKVLSIVVLLFPPSPFKFIENSQYADFISQINFFIPVYEFLVIAQAWLVAVGFYYLYSIYARWVKAID